MTCPTFSNSRATGFIGGLRYAALFSILLTAEASIANAASETWVGNSSTDWAGSNWSGTNNPPVSGDSLTFGTAGSSGTTLTNTLTSSSFNVAGITFTSGASSYTMTGNAFALTGGITNSSTSNQTFYNAITMASGQTFTTTSGGGNITLAGKLTASGGITTAGTGTTVLSGSGDTTTTITVNGGTLDIGGYGVTTSTGGTYLLSGSGTITSSGGGAISLNGSNGWLTSSGTLTINAVIQNGTGNQLNTNGNGGTVVLGGANTQTGALIVSNGVLVLANSLAAQNAQVAMNNGNESLIFSSAVTSGTFVFGSLTGNSGNTNNNIVLQNNAATPAPVTILVGNNNSSNTYSAVLSGSGGFTKTGSGSETLNGVNTYTGATGVNDGTLILTAGSTGSPLYSGVTAGGLVLGGASQTLGNLGNGNSTSPTSILQINGQNSGSSTQSFGGTTLKYGYSAIQATPGSGTASVTVNLGAITHQAGGTVLFATPTLGGAVTTTGSIKTTSSNDASGILGGYAIVTNQSNVTSGNTLNYASVDGSGNIIAYTGYTNSGSTINDSGAGTPTNITLNSTTVGTGATLTNGAVNINTILDSNGSTTLTVGSVLRFGVNGGVLLTGSGLNITGGTITAGGNTLGTAGEISFLSPQDGNALTINSTIANNNASTGSANSAGAGAVTITYSGYTGLQDVINGANTYSGGTYIEGGRLQAANLSSFGTGTVYVLPGGEAFLTANGTYANNFVISGNGASEGFGALRASGNITLSGTVTLAGDSQINGVNSGMTLNGQITGTGNLTFTNNNTFTLGNSSANLNNWVGNLTLGGNGNGVTVKEAANNQIPDGVGAGNVIINNGSVLELNGFSDTLNNLTATTTVGQGTVQNSTTSSASTLGVGNSNLTFTYNGAIRDGAGSGSGSGTLKLDKVGTGIFTVGNTTASGTSANDYTGGTQIDGGTLQLAASAPTNILGSTAGALTVNTGGTLDLNGNSLTVGALSGTGGVITSTATGALTLTEGNSTSTTFSGVIKNTEATSISLIKQGSGVTDLTGANTYTGTTSINAGTLEIGSGGSIANVAGISFGASSTGTLGLGDSSGGTNLTLTAPISGSTSSTVIAGTGTTPNSTLTLNGSGTQVYVNPLRGNLNLVISGTGTTPTSTLSGTSNYTGSTTVNSGATLNLTGALGSTAVTVNSGGTLSGTGNGTTTGLIGGSVNALGGSAITLATTGTVFKSTGAIVLGTSGSYGSGNYTTLTYTLGGSNTTETLQTGSTLTASNAFVNISNPSQTGTYTLANYSSLTAGYDFSLSSSTGNVLTQNIGRNSETLTVGTGTLTLVIAGAGAPGVAYFDGAVSQVWNDLSNATKVNFSTNLAGTNDGGNIVGATSDVILNANTVTTTNTQTLGGSLVINSLRVNSNGTTTLGNPGDTTTLTINALADSNTASDGSFTGNTAGTGIVVGSGASAFTMNVPVILGGNQSWKNNSASAFTVNGSVTGQVSTTSTLTLSNTSTGSTTLNGALSDGASGTLGLVVNNTGSGITTIANAGNTYSGGTILNDGTLTSTGTGGLGAGSVTVNPTGTAGTSADAATLNTTNSIASTAAVTVNSNSATEIGTINFNGSTPTIGSLAGTGKVVLNNAGGTTLTVGSTNNLSSTFSGSIGNGAGTGSLIKAGTGTLNLSGTNTYSGSTTVNAGVLLLSGTDSYAGATTINSTSTLRVGSSTALPSNTLTGGSNLVINSGGNLDLNNFNVSLSGLANGTGTITNGSATSGTSTLALAATGTLTQTLTDSGTGHGLLSLSVTSGSVTIANANTYVGGTSISGGQVVLTNNGGAGTGTIALGSAGALTLNYSGNNNNAITGGGTINTVDTGGGSQTLSGNMASFTGTINVGTASGSGGKTIVSDFGASNPLLSSASTINIASGGTFFVQTYSVASTINVSGTGNGENFGALRVDYGANLTGTINLLGNTTFGGANGTSGTISGVIGDGGNGYNLTEEGNITEILSGANTFSGNTAVTSGILDLANTNALQNSTLTTGRITFDSSVTSNAFTFGGLSGSGSITLANNAGTPAAVALSIGNNNSSQTYSGVLSGAGSLNLIGSGTELLTGTNTYTGSTTVSNGTLQLGNGTSGSISASSAVSVASPGTLSVDEANGSTIANAIANSGNVIGNEDSGITNTFSNTISGSGSFTQNGVGTTILSATNGYTGATTVNNGGTLQLGINNAIGSSSAVTITNGTLAMGTYNDTVAGVVLGSLANSSITGTGVLTSTGSFDLDNGSVSAILAGSVGATIGLDESGTVTLSGANTYTGLTEIEGTGNSTPSIAIYQNGTAFGGNSAIQVDAGGAAQVQGNIAGGSKALSLGGTGSDAGATGALENLSGSNSYAGLITLSSNALVTSDSGTLTLTGGVTTASGKSLTVGGPGSTVIGSGAITGAGAFATTGAANVLFTGNNTYTGTTTIASSTTLQVGNGGTTGSISASSPIKDNGTFIVNRSNALSEGSNISGTGVLMQTGSGTTTLSGTDSYSGLTTVASGGLNIIGSTLSTGTVSISSGATLKGTGSTGRVTLNSGAAVNLADSAVGTLTIGGLSTTGGGSLTFDIGTANGSNDLINDTGLLSAAGTTTINLNALGSVSTGSYTLLSYTGTQQSLSAFSLSASTLGGKNVTLGQSGDNIYVLLTPTATSTTYSLATTAGASRIMNGQTTTLTTTITNTGTGIADTLNYSGLGATATTVSGATTSGGPLANGGGSASNTGQIFTGSVAGANTITPTGSGTNATLGGSATQTGTTTATVNVLNNRTETASSVALGRVLVNGTTGSQTTTITSPTGQDGSLTRTTLGGSAQASTVTNGTVTLASGTAYQFGGANDATNSTTRGVTGVFTTAGNQSGTANFTPTGEGLTGESVNPIGVAYTADAVNQRTFSVGTSPVALGRFLLTSTPTGSTAITSTGLNVVTGNASLGSFSSVNGLSLTTGDATAFNGAASSQTANYSVGGTASSAGNFSGSFSSTVSAELGSIAPVTVAVTGDAVNQRTFSVGTSPVALGRFLITSSPTGSTAITSTGLNNVTANASLGSFSSVNGLSLTTGDATAFNGATSSQTANYSIGGTAASAGSFSGSFSSTVSAELGSIAPVTVAVTGDAVNQRSFSVTGTPIALGRYLVGTTPSGSVAVSSTGLNDTTGNASLGAFNSVDGLTLTTTDPTAFNGATSSQTATYALGGTATTGNFSGTFSSTVSAEFGSIAPVTVAITADAVNQRSFSVGTSPVALGRFLISSSPTGSTAITSTGLNNVTANASLGSFSSVNGLSLTTGDATAFNGATSSQTANYSVGGTASSAGSFSGSFSSTVGAELGSIAPVTVAVTGDAVNQRTFSVGTSPVALGRFLISSSPTGSTAITSTGLNDTTGNASLGSFSSVNGLNLTTGDSTAFNGGTSSQTANYSVGGTAASAGSFSGSFSSTVGAELGSIAPVTVAVTGDAVNQRSFSVTGTPVALGRYLVGTTPSGSVAVSSTGLNDTTGNASLGAFNSVDGLTLTTTDPTAFNGATSSQTATYALGGTATTGNFSGTFSSTVTAELGSIAPVTVAITADAVNQRTFSVSTSPVALGRFIATATPSGSTSVTSTGLNDVTANASLGTFSTVNGLGLTTGDSTTFNGASSSQTANYAVNGTASGLGSFSGTFSSTVSAELGSIAPVTVAVTGDAVTQRVVNTGAVTDLGFVHSGAAVSATANAFSSTGTHDTTTDVTVAGGDGVTTSNGVTLSGSSTSFNGPNGSSINGSTQTFGGNLTSGSGGTTTGSFNLGVTGEGLTGEGSYSDVNVAYTSFVYTGQGVWNTNGGGSWGAVSETPANWTANGGTPGLDANFTSTDSAFFGSVTTSGTANVTLDGDNPSLNAITFNNGSASYNIGQGTGTGSITLNGGLADATVTNLGGIHEISAPVHLATSADINVSSGQQLTLSGTLSGPGGLNTTTGSGTTIITGDNSYAGGTAVNAGVLRLSNSSGSATGSGALSVGAGAVLAGSGTSNSSGLSITGDSSTRATVLVGYNNGLDTNTTNVMTLTAPTASLGSARLEFNINANTPGQGTELAIANTAVTFNTVGTLNTQLALNIEGNSFIAAFTPYVLVAGTGTTIMGTGTSALTATATSGQFAGIDTFINAKGQNQIVTGSTQNLQLTFNDPAQAAYYAQSYLFIVNHDGEDDIEVEVVPEPGTWAMMLGGLALLIVWQRRKNQSR